jgi:hypothetical protein
MDALPSNSGLTSILTKPTMVDRMFSKSFLLTCIIATVSVVSAGFAQADEKKEKDLRISIQLGQPVPVYQYRAPVQPVLVQPAPVVIYEDRQHDSRGHGRHNNHRNHGRYSHADHGHANHNHHYYDQPQARYWVPAHQIWRGGVWMTSPGFYTTSYVAPIPAPLYEPQPRVVSPGWLWVRGHWAWGGVQWSWAPGVWVRM